MKQKLIPFLILAVSLSTSCGTTSTSSSSVTTETVSQLGSVAADDAADAIVDDASANVSLSAQAALTKEVAAADTDITVSKTCTKAADGTVSVVRNTTGSGSKTLTRPKATVVVTMTATGKDTRKWTPPTGASIDCTSATGSMKANWASSSVVNGLKLDVTIDRTRDFSRAITVTRTGTTTTTVDNATISGTRAITWATGTTSATTISRVKTITMNVTRKKTFTNKDNSTTTLTTTVTTKDGAPLSVTVERLASGGTLQKKTISSGTVVTTTEDGGKLESAFSNVIYDMTSSSPCLPTGGSITGNLFAKDATTASSTFTITFGADTDSGVSISHNGGTAEDYPEYTGKGCDLERES